MEEVTVVRYRPIKLLAVIFTAIAVLLLIIAVAASDWVQVKFQGGEDSWQTWGLWAECFEVISGQPVCVDKSWMQACAGLTIISLLAGIFAAVMGIVGLCTHKRMVYVIAGCLTLFGAVFMFIAIIVYPVKFSGDIGQQTSSNIQRWDFDWTYGVAVGGMLFLIGAAVFYFLKQENQEVETEKPTAYPSYYVNSSHSHP